MPRPESMNRLPDWVSVFWYTRQFQNVGNKAKRSLQRASIPFREGFDNIIKSFYILVKRVDLDRASQLLDRELGA
jgi:hypothetical protein